MHMLKLSPMTSRCNFSRGRQQEPSKTATGTRWSSTSNSKNVGFYLLLMLFLTSFIARKLVDLLEKSENEVSILDSVGSKDFFYL